MFGIELDTGTIATIITLFLTAIGAISGVVLAKINKFFTAVKESSDVMGVINQIGVLAEQIPADDKVTQEEADLFLATVKKMKPEIEEAKLAWKDLFSK